jgi:hypothetical protein
MGMLLALVAGPQREGAGRWTSLRSRAPGHAPSEDSRTTSEFRMIRRLDAGRAIHQVLKQGGRQRYARADRARQAQEKHAAAFVVAL